MGLDVFGRDEVPVIPVGGSGGLGGRRRRAFILITPASLRTTFLLPPCFRGDEFVEATFRINRAKSSKFNGLLARPKRFELLTPRFVDR